MGRNKKKANKKTLHATESGSEAERSDSEQVCATVPVPTDPTTSDKHITGEVVAVTAAQQVPVGNDVGKECSNKQTNKKPYISKKTQQCTQGQQQQQKGCGDNSRIEHFYVDVNGLGHLEKKLIVLRQRNIKDSMTIVKGKLRDALSDALSNSQTENFTVHNKSMLSRQNNTVIVYFPKRSSKVLSIALRAVTADGATMVQRTIPHESSAPAVEALEGMANHMQVTGMKNLKNSKELKGRHEIARDDLKLLDEDGNELDVRQPNAEVWPRAATLVLGPLSLRVLYDVPTVVQMTPPSVLIEGHPATCANLLLVSCTCEEDLQWKWVIDTDVVCTTRVFTPLLQHVRKDVRVWCCAGGSWLGATTFTRVKSAPSGTTTQGRACDPSTGSGTVQPITKMADDLKMVKMVDPLRVVSYNILHDDYVTNDKYPFASDEILALNYRKGAIARELSMYHPDIVLLQECGQSLFESFLAHTFRHDVMEAHYTNKGGKSLEGNVIAFATDRFEALPSYTLALPLNADTLSSQHVALAAKVKEHPHLFDALQQMTAVAAVMVLKDRKDENRHIIVANTHLHDRYCISNYAKYVLYPFASDEVRALSYRKGAIARELSAYHADIVLLQECGQGLFESFLVHTFRHDGMKAHYTNKCGQTKEGNVIAFATDRFEAVSSHTIPLNAETLSSQHTAIAAEVEEHPHLYHALQQMTAVAAVVVLKDRKDEIRHIIVANTHLFYHSDACHVRVLQVYMLVQAIAATADALRAEGKCVHVIFGGDFNASPTGAPIELLTTGALSGEHRCWDKGRAYKWERDDKEREGGVCFASVFRATLTLPMTFEDTLAEPSHRWTTYSPSFKEIIDFIFVGRFAVKEGSPSAQREYICTFRTVPQPLEAELMKDIGIPSKKFPSDHIAQIVDLAFATTAVPVAVPAPVAAMAVSVAEAAHSA